MQEMACAQGIFTPSMDLHNQQQQPFAMVNFLFQHIATPTQALFYTQPSIYYNDRTINIFTDKQGNVYQWLLVDRTEGEN